MERTISNFNNNSFTTFKECKTPNRHPDFISLSGSRYWYGSNKNGQYVIRQSDHWGKVSSCVWKLFSPYKVNNLSGSAIKILKKECNQTITSLGQIKSGTFRTGKAYISSFYKK